MSDKLLYEPPYLFQPRPQSRLHYNRDGLFSKSSQTLKCTHTNIKLKVLLVSPESLIYTYSVLHCFPPHQLDTLNFETWMWDNRTIVWALPQGGLLDWALVASLRANQLCPCRFQCSIRICNRASAFKNVRKRKNRAREREKCTFLSRSYDSSTCNKESKMNLYSYLH